MNIVAIDKDNQSQHQRLIDEYADLKKYWKVGGIPNFRPSLQKGDMLFVSLDHRGKVSAGVMLNKYVQDTRSSSNVLPANVGTVAYMHTIVSAEDSHDLMPGLALQNKIINDFRDKKGIFEDVDVMTANLVPRNMLIVYEAAKTSGLKIVARKDVLNGPPGEQTIFVAATANQNLSLVPQGCEAGVLAESEMASLAHQVLTEFKNSHPSEKKRARALKRKGKSHDDDGIIGR
jgi:hypothetical protein